MPNRIEWSVLHRERSAARDELQPILRLPITPSYQHLAAATVREGEAVLDVGAGDRQLEQAIAARLKAFDYFSLDTDPNFEHEYRDFEQLDREFDVIAMLEIIEHVPLPTAMKMFAGAHAHLRPGGRLVVSTPNVHHPTWFWRDPTHVTPYRYTDLVGLLRSSGFAAFEVWRVKRLRWKDRLRGWRYRPLLRLLDLDFAPGIVVRCRVEK